MNTIKKSIKKKIVLRTLAMPSDTNANGDIFGGWIMSQMDMGGAILAKQISKGKVVTLKVHEMIFFKRISIGDLVSCYAHCINIGNTSLKIKIEVWIKKITSQPLGSKFKIAKAIFTYVAIDKNGNPRFIFK
ncbi:acyl-CoA thioester hydrolase YciA [Buchnera aphidicola]|uniref:Acyl-CoA thioester hydrolase YciA n=1 Tax=Buchnera aphidicola (Therioaphis trifolii) TaxID=1241884 RepID=A0A4D6YPJ4_9GAMM|nr:acyl-CoA thioester hydrolase YciA [Buchnera aphidicola]QCI27185.1 acyl-CoA thioester hydrolase YciA [Buchnera aphidicola (Therioaphis trifolii)]